MHTRCSCSKGACSMFIETCFYCTDKPAKDEPIQHPQPISGVDMSQNGPHSSVKSELDRIIHIQKGNPPLLNLMTKQYCLSVVWSTSSLEGYIVQPYFKLHGLFSESLLWFRHKYVGIVAYSFKAQVTAMNAHGHRLFPNLLSSYIQV